MTESNLKNKPLSEWTLDEVVENCKKSHGEYGEYGNGCESCPFFIFRAYRCSLDVLPPSIWDLHKETQITEAELAICKAVGAKWVSKNPHECYVCLWEDKPVYADGEYKGKRLLGFFTEERFPSIRPDDLVCVEGANA